MPIIYNQDVSFDYIFDVCVVGAGACGLTAATSAAQNGADVAIFERDKTPAGATAMGYGAICAANSKSQRAAGIVDDANALFDDIITAAQNQTDQKIARVLADHSGPTVDWLCESVGCDLTLETSWGGYGHRVPRMHVTPNRNGEEIISMLMDGAEKAGANLITQATVKDLIVDDNNHIRGIVYDSPDGEETIGCKALILASSGYGANKELIRKYIPEMADATYYGCENHRGDAVLWGQELGAQTGDMGAYQGLGTLADPQAIVVPHTVLIAGGFQVNSDGRRFQNELENISGQGRNVIGQPGGISYVIYDARGHAESAERYAGYRDGAQLLTSGRTANNFDELAAIAKIDPAGLQATLDDIESLKKSGDACSFGRHFGGQDKLEPPFYAVKVTGALFHTQGGLCIDETMRVLSENGTPFPNLFAGGGAVRSVSGPAEWGYLPAMGMATATVFGKLAGENAAALATES